MPMNAGDAGGMVAQALTVFDAIRNKTSGNLKEGAKGPWGAQ
jgi:hypothetical protein